jgi:hypothetical protein
MQRFLSCASQRGKENAMKYLLFILMASPVFAFKCGKSSGEKRGYVTGKVIRTSCAGVIIQVLNDDTVGEDGWKDMMNNDGVYDNVFTVNNSCKVGENLGAGKTIRFKVDKPTNTECAFCLMYDGQPKTKYDISEVSVVEGK